MAVPLLRTKLFIPPLKPGLVARPHLTGTIDNALAGGARLVLLSAPAGYGKSTLVSEWVEQRRRDRSGAGPAAGWLSLDEEDNDEPLFWSYLVAALAEAAPTLVRGADEYLQAQPLSTRGLLIHLLNQAAALPPDGGSAVLVIDDYHLITNPAIHEALAFFLEHLPPQLRVILITRADPPLPVARMRARGQAVSLRAALLRFAREEVAVFLNQVKSLDLSAPQVAALAARTEGWPAGLQMAAVALESVTLSGDRSSIARFVDTFSGAQRYILDFLLEEILSRQPEAVQTFLLRTSILERLSAGLCAAVTAGSEAVGPDENHQVAEAAALLDHLDRANLFLFPLDQERHWYRYHHLFADLLQARLEQGRSEEVRGLHRRAAAWYQAKGLAAEAIGHALKAEDAALAADLIERHTRPLLVQGQIHTLLRSIAALPAEVTNNRPWLSVYQAWALSLGGQYRPAAALVAQVEQQLPETGRNAAEQQELHGHLAAILAFQAAATTVGDAALGHARRALELLPPAVLWPRGLAEWSLGYTHRMSGRLEEAVPHFLEVIRIGHDQGDLQAIASAQYDLAMIRRRQGRLLEAVRLFEEVLALTVRRGAAGLGYLGRVEAGLAEALLEQNRLQEARRHVERSLLLNQNWQNPNHDLRTHLVLAGLELAEGNLEAAVAAWQEADTISGLFPVVPVLRDAAAALRLELWLQENDLLAASAWLVQQGWPREGLVELARQGAAREQTLLAVIRVRLAEARPDGDGEQLERVREALAVQLSRSQEGGLGEITIAALTLQALAYRLLDREEQALSALEQAVRLAAPEGFARTFLDRASPMHALLARLEPRLRRRYPQEVELHRFLAGLLAAFKQPAAGEESLSPGTALSGPTSTQGPAAAGLVEPLTERELEVLALLAEGLTNQQIAGRLFVARGTVKAHAASIYGKLDVHNRTSAVARARELHIL